VIKRAVTAILLVVLVTTGLILWQVSGRSWGEGTALRKASSLSSLSAVSPDYVWTVGSAGQTYLFDGRGWKEYDSGTKALLLSVASLDNKHVWAVGEKGTVVYFNGFRWSRQESGTDNTLKKVVASSKDNVWAVGDTGTVLHFDGSEWKNVAGPTERTLNGVALTSSNQVWVAGPSGAFLFSDNSWKRMSTEAFVDISASGLEVWGITRRYDNAGFCVSDIFSFDGNDWRLKHTVPDCQLYSVFTDGGGVLSAGSGGTVVSYDGSRWRTDRLSYFSTFFGATSDAGHLWVAGAVLSNNMVQQNTLRGCSGNIWRRWNIL
jgi:hypothetical protein